jgi:hypothetical protein
MSTQWQQFQFDYGSEVYKDFSSSTRSKQQEQEEQEEQEDLSLEKKVKELIERSNKIISSF